MSWSTPPTTSSSSQEQQQQQNKNSYNTSRRRRYPRFCNSRSSNSRFCSSTQHHCRQEQIETVVRNNPDNCIVAYDIITALQHQQQQQYQHEQPYQSEKLKTEQTITTDGGLLFYHDVIFMGYDKQPVYGCKFILACRCPIFYKMFTGPFQEGSANNNHIQNQQNQNEQQQQQQQFSSIIQYPQYHSTILQWIVQYCYTNQFIIPTFIPTQTKSTTTNTNTNTNTNLVTQDEQQQQQQYIRYLVQLFYASDYFQLLFLQQQVYHLLCQYICTYPPIACIVYDESYSYHSLIEHDNNHHHDDDDDDEHHPYVDDPNNNNNSNNNIFHPPPPPLDLYEYSYKFIVHRPYVTLDVGCSLPLRQKEQGGVGVGATTTTDVLVGLGGIGSIHHVDKVRHLFANANTMGVSEFFLLRMIYVWYYDHYDPYQPQHPNSSDDSINNNYNNNKRNQKELSDHNNDDDKTRMNVIMEQDTNSSMGTIIKGHSHHHDTEEEDLDVYQIAKQFIQQYIQLHYIEQNELLSLRTTTRPTTTTKHVQTQTHDHAMYDYPPLLSNEQIYQAILVQQTVLRSISSSSSLYKKNGILMTSIPQPPFRDTTNTSSSSTSTSRPTKLIQNLKNNSFVSNLMESNHHDNFHIPITIQQPVLVEEEDEETEMEQHQQDEEERILVENAGNHDVNGMYYRIVPNIDLIHGTTLYSKREMMCGQSIVYTLSCRTILILRSSNTSSSRSKTRKKCAMEKQKTSTIHNNMEKDDSGANIQQSTPSSASKQQQRMGQEPCQYVTVREYRIFSNPFLSYNAVKRFDQMQKIPSTFSLRYQPILQILDIIKPCDDLKNETKNHNHHNNYNHQYPPVPIPIRKYYRVRLSDGTIHMTGTLSREVIASFLETNDFHINAIIQILEFGLYRLATSTAFGNERKELATTGIHVMKARIVKMTPATTTLSSSSSSTPLSLQPPLGNPVPLEEIEEDLWTSGSGDNDDPTKRYQHENSQPSINRQYQELIYPTDMPMPQLNNVYNTNHPLTLYHSSSKNNSEQNICHDQGLRNLYLCHCPLDDPEDIKNDGMDQDATPTTANTNTRSSCHRTTSSSSSTSFMTVPRTGWMVDEHGTGPAPTCTWIPSRNSNSSSINSSTSCTNNNNYIERTTKTDPYHQHCHLTYELPNGLLYI